MKNIRAEFPQINDNQVYFDNAATTFKPRAVISALSDYYEKYNANPRRGLYPLAVEATQLYEQDRKNIAEYIGANVKQIVFTRGATESLNMIALGLPQNSEVIVAQSEHHSNLLPWREHHRVTTWPLDNNHLTLDSLKEIVKEQTKIVAFSPFSNVLGKVMSDDELEKILAFLKDRGITSVVDATQWIAHEKISVKNIDFLVFSGHKIYGPMGIGVLYGARLERLRPTFFGGEMVDDVSKKITLADVPERFEAGTMNPAASYALSAALEYAARPKPSFEKNWNELQSIPFIKIYSNPGPILSFNIEGVHPHDVAQYLANSGICVRAGYHCAQPLLDSLKIGPCVRASLGIYNTAEEIERFIAALKNARKAMGYV